MSSLQPELSADANWVSLGYQKVPKLACIFKVVILPLLTNLSLRFFPFLAVENHMPKRLSTVCVSVRVSGYNKHHDQSNLADTSLSPFISGEVRTGIQTGKEPRGRS